MWGREGGDRDSTGLGPDKRANGEGAGVERVDRVGRHRDRMAEGAVRWSCGHNGLEGRDVGCVNVRRRLNMQPVYDRTQQATYAQLI